jgi:hypothetical protein
MKTTIFILLSIITQVVFSQELRKEFDATNIKYLLVANIQGDIQVTGTNTDQIMLSANQTIKNKVNGSDPEIGFLQEGDTLAVYIQSDCNHFSLNRRKSEGERNWGYSNWDECNKQTSIKVDFAIRVPLQTVVILSTINDGDIQVENIETPIWVNNINGHVNLTQVTNISDARTINGDVTIRFKNNPKQTGFFYTLNGNINAFFPADLEADISFKTFQGNFFTDFEKAKAGPPKIEATHREDGFIYKLDARSNIRINNGGINLDFESFNGNLYLRTI